GKTPTGKITEALSIRVDEIRTVQSYPMLTYVFFAEGDGTRPLRQELLTREQAAIFRVENALGDELTLYRNMLNIIGRRLRDNPRAKITLTGTNADYGVERGATALSRQRAETIKSYFTDVWNIDSRRITVRARNLPQDPSVVELPEGQEENRRVEITSDDPSIIAPIPRDEIEYEASLAGIEIIPAVDAPNGIDRWSLNVVQAGKSLFSREQGGPVPSSFSWTFEGDAFKRESAPVSVSLYVRDRIGQERTAQKQVVVNTFTLERKRQERIGDVLVNRSRLILFDFNKATISPRNKAIITEVSKSITPTSRVKIYGYTDRLGDAEYNVRLSQQRADAVRAEFGARLTNIPVESVGLGSSQLLFPNDTPEGRIFCRMVVVIIETPVNE
ncbi:MAG: OmpA family protein, partial [Bacteroidota bacterium]|nr:OmpA family protein [Bacteroidota bacterium]